MKIGVRFMLVLVALWVAASGSGVFAQGYPNRAIQILVPYAPGTGIDFFHRLVAERLKKDWQVPVNVVNKVGAGGALATEEVIKARKDGYTLLSMYVSGPSTMTAANPDGPINMLRDLTPIAVNWASSGDILVVRSQSEFKTLADLVNYARKNPGKLICSTGMVGSDPYLGVLLFRKQAKIDFVHLSLSTMSENVNTLLGGHSDCANFAESVSIPHIEAGRVRALAVSMRSIAFPNVPTFAELGYDQYDLIPSIVIWGPKGLPQDVIQAWEKVLTAASKDPDFIAALKKAGHRVDLRLGTERLNAMMKEAVTTYSRFTPEELGWGKAKK